MEKHIRESIEKAKIQIFTSIVTLFLNPYIFMLIWNWQIKDTVNIQLTYWQCFWLYFILKNSIEVKTK